VSGTTKLVSVDIGGTNARFALAEVSDGRVLNLGEATVFHTGDYASFERAYAAFAEKVGALPKAVAVSFAGPVHGAVLKLTNSAWVIRPDDVPGTLGLDQFLILNDFGAVAHAVMQSDIVHLRHICGPDAPLPSEGVVSIVGPGTGLGVAYARASKGSYTVTETEGGHLDFAPLDGQEDRMLASLRAKFRRVSNERIVSGSGFTNIYHALAEMEGQAVPQIDDVALWTSAMDGSDTLAVAALDRFCLCFGGVAGDLALAQGAGAVVLAGGVGLRLADRLGKSGFAERFVAKGRFERMMADMPVRLITHPQPGLYGAAAAFAQKFTA